MNEKFPEIIIEGYAGESGARLIALGERARLATRFRDDTINQICAGPYGGQYVFHSDEERLMSMCDEHGADVINLGDGGILKGIYQEAVERKCGLKIYLSKVPILQSTIEICEMFGLDPFRLFSYCHMIMCDNASTLCDKLTEAGYAASVVGYMQSSLDKVIADKEEIEYINRPTRDEYLRYQDITYGRRK